MPPEKESRDPSDACKKMTAKMLPSIQPPTKNELESLLKKAEQLVRMLVERK
jgi:hypothetical protein